MDIKRKMNDLTECVKFYEGWLKSIRYRLRGYLMTFEAYLKSFLKDNDMNMDVDFIIEKIMQNKSIDNLIVPTMKITIEGNKITITDEKL